MNKIKNKIKILINNFKYFIFLIKEKEIPKKNIKKNLKFILNPNQYFEKSNNKINIWNLFLSSENKRVTSSRLEQFNNYLSYFKEFNIVFFSNHQKDLYMKKNWVDSEIYSIYKKCKFQQMKADIFRYCILYQYGGFWIDFKSSIYFSVKEIMNEKSEVLLLIGNNKIKNLNEIDENHSITNFRMIENWFLGSKPNSKFLKFVIDDISTNYINYQKKVFDNPKEAILNFTGPKRLTYLFYKYIIFTPDWKQNIQLINEEDFNFQYSEKYGRNFKLLNNIIFHSYSNLKFKKIID